MTTAATGQGVTTASDGGSARRRTPLALALVGFSAVLLLVTAVLGPSAGEPPLRAGSGWRATLPPWSMAADAPSGLVTGLMAAAYLLGGVGVGLGLWGAWRRERLPRWAVPAACAVAVLAVVVPPIGSADHLSYAAYGRIAASGGDPYVEAPRHWLGGHDPVTSAVEPPWTWTPSVYGPVATLVQAFTSVVGGDSVRATVWVWQLVCLAAWLAVGLLLVRLRDRGSGGDRAAWLWLLNPVLLGLLLLGAHVDVLAAALALGAIVLAGRRPVVAGMLLGAAVGVKLNLALVGPAVLWALWCRDGWRAWRPALLGVLGSAVVLAPSWLWAGPHVLDQLQRARTYVSLATPWRPFVEWVTGPVAKESVRDGVARLAPFVVLLVAVAVWRLSRRGQTPDGSLDVTREAARVSVVLSAAYVLGAPYSLPWYDAAAWAPLALVASPALDAVLLARLVIYALAYVPGRVVGMSAAVEKVTLGYRADVAPWLGLGLLAALVAVAGRRPPRGERARTARSPIQK